LKLTAQPIDFEIDLPSRFAQILNLLIKLFSSVPSRDYFAITQCFVYLNDPSLASSLLSELLNLSSSEKTAEPEEEKVLTAYQIAFDLAETATQEFLQVVRSSLSPASAAAPDPFQPVSESAEILAARTTTEGEAKKEDSTTTSHRERIIAILSGEESIKLYLEFLYRNNHADLLILKNTMVSGKTSHHVLFSTAETDDLTSSSSQGALEARNSIYHSAVSFMNAFANAGTTSDQFLRENLDWLAKASNWSKFTTTAALGVIHKGNLAQGKTILEPYLPGSSTAQATKSVYSEGGSLYALGLVNANHGKEETTNYLLETLKGTQDEVIMHGAALGLGVAAMGSGNEGESACCRVL
jgi:26S proteasome regulatory subunit N2